MRSEHILDQIDTALHDWTVSGDAMRSTPHPPPRPATAPQIWISTVDADPDEGGWQEVGSVRDIDFHIQPPEIDPDFQRAWQEFREYLARAEAERIRRVRAAIEALGRAVKPVMEAAAQAAANAAEVMQQINPPLPPGRRHDRPAWQSPYGPARRRR